VRIENEILLDFKDVLIRPKRSTLGSRKEVSLSRTYKFKHSGLEWCGIPIMAANMDGVGTIDMAKALQDNALFTCLTKTTAEIPFELNPYRYAISTGTSNHDFERVSGLIQKYPYIQFICIDVANGYSEYFGDFVAKVRKEYPNHTIIAGNVVTADMTQELILRGADIIKVGIGPGSVCTTRIQTGVGYAQLSAIMECADAAHGLGGHIIADVGCVCPGDVAKAFGAGADFVMLGGMLAGHKEGGGKIINRYFQTNQLKVEEYSEWGEKVTKEFIVEKKQFVQFYGMSSETAMNKHHGGVAEYRSSEGRTVEIPYKGAVEDTIKDILGGLRSTCTYVGAPSLKQLSKCTTFVRVTQQANQVFVNK
jgi:GMP reductase